MSGVGPFVRELFSERRGEARVFFLSAAAGGSVFEILYALAADTGTARVRFIALNLMLGGAAGFAGGVFGFIFGIPRSLGEARGSQPAAEAAESRSRSKPNTNLEQISDWLTKLLLGAGLANLATIPHFIVKTIGFLDRGAYNGLPGGGTMAILIVIFFISLGFYWSYVETRTYLTDLLEDASKEGENQP